MTSETILARDLMSTGVATVPPEMPVRAVAQLLREKGISSVPVSDGTGRLLGIVTEADLLRRVAGAADPARSWLARLVRRESDDAAAYAKKHGRVAGDIMSTQLVTAGPDTTATDCAQLMEKKQVKRLPIVTADGRLVGLISRADLLVAAIEASPDGGTKSRSDADIRKMLRREINKESWAYSLYTSTEVKDGVVTFHGFVQSDEVRRGLCLLASRIEGVREVIDQMEQAPAFLPGEMV